MKIEELSRDLNHAELEVRHRALKVLLQKSDHEAYGLLMYVAHNHFSPETRHEAKKCALVLQKSLFAKTPANLKPDESRSVQDLGSVDPGKKETAIAQLKQMQGPDKLATLIKQLQKESDPARVQELIRICAELGGKEVFSYLVPFLRSGSEAIRQTVISVSSHFSGPEVILLLLRFTRDPSSLVQQEAIKQLSQISSAEVLHEIEKLSQKSHNPVDREAIVYVVAKLGITGAIPVLELFIQDANLTIQKHSRQALQYLQKLKTRESPTLEAQASLPKTEEKPLPSEQPISLESSQTVDIPSEIVPTPESITIDENTQEEIRQIQSQIAEGEDKIAVQAIFKLIEKSWFHVLEELKPKVLQREQKKILASFIMALGQTKDKSHSAYLFQCLEHADSRVQANAIEALHRIGSGEQKEKVLPFLKSKNDRVKTNAIIFLHPYRLVDTLAELRTMLSSGKENRQLSAIFAISDLFEPELVSLLEIAMDSPNSKVSKKGIEVLKMYVQAKQEKAMKLASQWGILSDLTTADLEEKPILDDTESESKAEEASTATQPEAKAKPASKWLDFIQNIFKKKGD